MAFPFSMLNIAHLAAGFKRQTHVYCYVIAKILASADPVALDQACIDLIWVSADNESFVNRVESRNGLHTLENAETIGLGSRAYRLVVLE